MTAIKLLEELERDVLNYMKVTAASEQSMREAIDIFSTIRAAVASSPPATVPAEALRSLVATWRGIPANTYVIKAYDSAIYKCADDLATLIEGAK